MSQQPPQTRSEASFVMSRTVEDCLSSTIYTPEGENVTPINLETMWRVGWPVPAVLPYSVNYVFGIVSTNGLWNPPLWESALMEVYPFPQPRPHGFYGLSQNAMLVQELPETGEYSANLQVYGMYFEAWKPADWMRDEPNADEYYQASETRLIWGETFSPTLPEPALETYTAEEKWPILQYQLEGEIPLATITPEGELIPAGIPYTREYVRGTLNQDTLNETYEFSVGLNDGFYPPEDSFSGIPNGWNTSRSEIGDSTTITGGGFRYPATHIVRLPNTGVPNFWSDPFGSNYGLDLRGEAQVGEVFKFYDYRAVTPPPVDEDGNLIDNPRQLHLLTTARLTQRYRRELSSGNGSETVLVFDRPVPFNTDGIVDVREGEDLPGQTHEIMYRTSWWSNPGGTEDPDGVLEVSVEVGYTFLKTVGFIASYDASETHYRMRYHPAVTGQVAAGAVYTFSYQGEELAYRDYIGYQPSTGGTEFGDSGATFKLWAGPGGVPPMEVRQDFPETIPFDLSWPAGGYVADECDWQLGESEVASHVPTEEDVDLSDRTLYLSGSSYRHVLGMGSVVSKKLLLDDFLKSQPSLPDGLAGFATLSPEVEAYYGQVNPFLYFGEDGLLLNPLALAPPPEFGITPMWFGLTWGTDVRWYVADAFRALWLAPGQETATEHLFGVVILEHPDEPRGWTVKVSVDRTLFWEGDLFSLFSGSEDPETGEKRLTFLDGRVWPPENAPAVRPHYQFVFEGYGWPFQDRANLLPFSARVRNTKTDKANLFGNPPPFEERPCPVTLHLQQDDESPLTLVESLPPDE